jgi:hypothetical protein
MSNAEQERDLEKFERWWFNEGSGYRPTPSEDTEEFVHRSCRVAWLNGAFCAQSGTNQEDQLPI